MSQCPEFADLLADQICNNKPGGDGENLLSKSVWLCGQCRFKFFVFG